MDPNYIPRFIFPIVDDIYLSIVEIFIVLLLTLSNVWKIKYVRNNRFRSFKTKACFVILLFTKTRVLAINKVDLIEKENHNKVINKFMKKVKYKGKAFNISALNGFGCKSLIFGLSKLIEQENYEK